MRCDDAGRHLSGRGLVQSAVQLGSLYFSWKEIEKKLPVFFHSNQERTLAADQVGRRRAKRDANRRKTWRSSRWDWTEETNYTFPAKNVAPTYFICGASLITLPEEVLFSESFFGFMLQESRAYMRNVLKMRPSNISLTLSKPWATVCWLSWRVRSLLTEWKVKRQMSTKDLFV